MDDKSKILDIAMNLNRVGNWAADGFTHRSKKIVIFLDNTRGYINEVTASKFDNKFGDIYKDFLNDFDRLDKEGREGPKDPLYWAEQMMTWGNILTHRSKFI